MTLINKTTKLQKKTNMQKSILKIAIIPLLVLLTSFTIQAFPNYNKIFSDSSNIEKKDRISFFDHLGSIGEMVEVTLETDLSLLVENRFSGNYQPAIFKYNNKDGETISFEIQLKPRGRLRRKICDIPPVKLNFSKKELKSKGIKKYDNFKLVSHCKSSKLAKKLVLREYLVYKLYNQMTPESFKVQLLNIKFIDTSGKMETSEKYGFLIENEDELAKRMNGEILEQRGVNIEEFDQNNYQRVAMFNYMVGNTDWDIKKLHNVKLIKRKDHNEILLIPYDFDYCGLVDADYARPSPDFGIPTVRDRHYRGFRYDHSTFPLCHELFLQKETELKNSLMGIGCLDKSCKRYTKKYLSSFYKILKKERRYKKHIKPDKIYVKTNKAK